MDRFFPVKKAVETVTAPDLVAAILFFRCADIFSGKRRETAYNLAQKSAAFLQKRVLASQQRLLCRAAKRVIGEWSWCSPTPVLNGYD